MGERREQVIQVDDGSALNVYCATCCRVLASLPEGYGMQTLAHQTAFGHWASYNEDHTVLVTDLHGKRMEYLQPNGQFRDVSDHD